MKRILCLLLCLMSIVACCSLTISAASEEASPSIMEELPTLYIDGKQFNEADYPANKEDPNKYVISVVEKGFKNISYSPDFALYLYVYNPNCEEIKRTNENSVQIGVNMHTDSYYYYGLTLASFSSDNRFLKFKVRARGAVGVDTLYMNQDAANERVYDIVTFRLYAGGSLAAYNVKKTFAFKGYDFDKTITCQSMDLYALDVEMYSTNWISPNAGFLMATEYDHYEINSVYFTLPKSLFDDETGYDYIESIRADFMKYQATPIIVTRPGDIDSTTKNAIKEGSVISLGGNVDVMDLTWFRNWGHFYTESQLLYETFKNDYDMYTYYNCLAYYFENSELPEDYEWDYGTVQQVAVSAEELEAYFYARYNDPNYDNSKLYTSEKHMVVDYNSADFGEDYLYEMETFMQNKTDLDKWFYKTWRKDDSYIFEDFDVTCNKIDVIKNPSEYVNVSSANYRTTANELFIGVNDVEHFSTICEQADANDEYVVLLRFGFSIYSCYPVVDYWESGFGSSDQVGFAIEKVFYRNVSLVHIVFSKNGQSVVVPVCSNTVDSFGDLTVYEDPEDDLLLVPDDKEDDFRDAFKEFWEKVVEFLKKALKILLIILLIPFSLPIIYFLVKLFLWLIKVISKPLKKKASEKTKDDKNEDRKE